MEIIEIDYNTAVSFLLPKHYSGRVPAISKAFGWYDCKTYTSEHLLAVCTFGKPASPSLCAGVCGKENALSVYELNRLCRVDDLKQPLSQFVSACLRRLKQYNWIIVSYSDTGMNHHGYIYQACNFVYTGCTKQRTDMYTENGKHSRHYKHEEQGEYRRVRTAKHRYVYFCTHDKKLKKKWFSELKYPICKYPKGDNNADYVLGEYMKPILVKAESKGINEPMNNGQACGIFRSINSENYTTLDKVKAIKIVANMETHNSISKDCMIDALKFMADIYVELYEELLIQRLRGKD